MTPKAPSLPVDLPRFLRAVEKTNPFKLDAVSGTKGGDIDVPEIHGKAYRRIQQAVEGVRTEGNATGVLLIASAGLGKSHLLARLERWAREDARSTMVILHNLVSTPERMARAVLGATINLLAGANEVAFAQSDLYALLTYAISKLHRGKGAPSLETRVKLLRDAGARLDPQGDVLTAFVAFLESTVEAAQDSPDHTERARIAVEWLSGQQIDASAARALGLRPSPAEISELPEGHEERVFQVLAGLGAVAGRPFILCLDQVDNLESNAIGALTRFLHALIDHVGNLVVITSGVKDAMLALRNQRVIGNAAWDRVAQLMVQLPMIVPAEAKKIAAARVDRFVEPFRVVEKVRAYRARDPLFPLSTAWLQSRLVFSELRPRDVISWCREEWMGEQRRLIEVGDDEWLRTWPPLPPTLADGHGPSSKDPPDALVDQLVSLKIAEIMQQRTLRPQSLPPDEGRLSQLVVQLLAQCAAREPYTLADYESCRRIPAGPYHILATERSSGREYLNGVTFIATTSKTAATNALKRITADVQSGSAERKPLDHRILVTDARRPLEVGPRGKEQLAALSELGPDGFRAITFSFDDYALLDALAAVLGAAKVGDLELEWPPGQFRTLGEKDAAEAMHRGKWFLRQPLLAELLTEDGPTNGLAQIQLALDANEVREFIVAELSWQIMATVRELAEIYVKRKPAAQGHSESVWVQLKGIARDLGAQGLLHVTASEDDLFLQSLKKS